MTSKTSGDDSWPQVKWEWLRRLGTVAAPKSSPHKYHPNDVLTTRKLTATTCRLSSGNYAAPGRYMAAYPQNHYSQNEKADQTAWTSRIEGLRSAPIQEEPLLGLSLLPSLCLSDVLRPEQKTSTHNVQHTLSSSSKLRRKCTNV